jgi:hypothetical protein
MSDAKPARKRKLVPSATEKRLMAGATIMKTTGADIERGRFYVFTDTGASARADVIERLIAAGKLRPCGDGLFGELSQTYAYA